MRPLQTLCTLSQLSVPCYLISDKQHPMLPSAASMSSTPLYARSPLLSLPAYRLSLNSLKQASSVQAEPAGAAGSAPRILGSLLVLHESSLNLLLGHIYREPVCAAHACRAAVPESSKALVLLHSLCPLRCSAVQWYSSRPMFLPDGA